MRRLSTDAGLSEATVKKIMSGQSRHPRHDTLQRLAKVLGCTLGDLLATGAPPEHPSALRPTEVMVRGAVEAGVWREAPLWDRADWYPLPTTEDPRFPGITRYALEVRGPAMDLVYPDSSIVILVDYLDLGRELLHGERVICRRRDRNRLCEATVKEYLVDAEGQALAPLPGPALPVPHRPRPRRRPGREPGAPRPRRRVRPGRRLRRARHGGGRRGGPGGGEHPKGVTRRHS
jgi:DNA-binding Xre family transcriptional regulator